MAQFMQMAQAGEEVPRTEYGTVNKSVDDEMTVKKSAKESKKKKKSTNGIDSLLKELNRGKKEKSKLGITIEKDVYDKLKTLSWTSGESISKITYNILKKSLEEVEINADYVAAFDEHFKEKRKKNK